MYPVTKTLTQIKHRILRVSVVFGLVFIIFDVQFHNGYKAIATRRLHRYLSYKSIRGSSMRRIPAAFVVRFMVLRNCSPRSMGRTRPRSFIYPGGSPQNPAGPIISSVICHDLPGDYRSRWQLFGYRLQTGLLCCSLLQRTVIMRRIKGMSYRSSLIARQRRTRNTTVIVTNTNIGRMCSGWLRS